jgi:hypothetical protein
MKTSLLWVVAFVTLSAGALQAQDLTGTWQGTLQAGRELRVVFKITKADGDGLKALMYSIDQPPGQGIPVSTVTLQGSTVSMSIVAAAATYEGRLSADGT